MLQCRAALLSSVSVAGLVCGWVEATRERGYDWDKDNSPSVAAPIDTDFGIVPQVSHSITGQADGDRRPV